MKPYLAIDIGGTAVKIGLVKESGQLLSTSIYPVNFDNYKTPVIHTVLAQTDVFLASNNQLPANLAGIAVSATGQIDTDKGIVAGTAGHIDNWVNTPIAELLTNKYRLPVTVANDANCAVMGEHLYGAARDFKHVVMITVGTGIGCGIIANNQLLSGTNGIAGELGHYTIKKDGLSCNCGNCGCYEKYASTTALVNMVKANIPKLQSGIEAEKIDGAYIFQQLPMGDPLLQALVNHWIDDIAIGLTGLIHIFNPEIVIIGGGVSKQQAFFIDPLKDLIYKKIMPGFRKNLTIQAAELGNNAGLLGAVAYFIKNVDGGDMAAS